MSIYILVAYVIEDTEILGVYGSRDVAEAQKIECEKLGWDATLAVLEAVLDKYYEPGLRLP